MVLEGWRRLLGRLVIGGVGLFLLTALVAAGTPAAWHDACQVAGVLAGLVTVVLLLPAWLVVALLARRVARRDARRARST